MLVDLNPHFSESGRLISIFWPIRTQDSCTAGHRVTDWSISLRSLGWNKMMLLFFLIILFQNTSVMDSHTGEISPKTTTVFKVRLNSDLLYCEGGLCDEMMEVWCVSLKAGKRARPRPDYPLTPASWRDLFRLYRRSSPTAYWLKSNTAELFGGALGTELNVHLGAVCAWRINDGMRPQRLGAIWDFR